MNRTRIVALTLLLSGLAHAGEPPKSPPPQGVALQSADKEVDEVFGQDITSAHTPKQQSDLANKLLATALGTQDDISAKFVLLCRARDLGERAHDIDTTFAALTEIIGVWQVDSLKLRIDAVARLANPMPLNDNAAALVDKADALAMEAVHADRYDLAVQAADQALALARYVRNPAIVARATQCCDEVHTIAEQFDKIHNSLATLDQSPADPDANLAVGKFRCFFKGDWTAGLPNLACGTDKLFRDLASLDLAGASTSSGEVELGDAWWDLSQNETGTPKNQMQARAGQWYTVAAPDLQGLTLAKVQSRMRRIGDANMPLTPIPASTVRTGKVVATSIALVADDFVTNIYLNGRRIPDANIHLDAEIFGATIMTVKMDVHPGDWIVFNVANDRFRWDGQCGFSAAGLDSNANVAFETEADKGDWSACNNPQDATQFIQKSGYLSDAHAVVPKKIWGGCNTELKNRHSDWDGKPLWDKNSSGIVWIKYVCP